MKKKRQYLEMNKHVENFLVVQWLGLGTFTALGPDSIPSWGTKTPQAEKHGQKIK